MSLAIKTTAPAGQERTAGRPLPTNTVRDQARNTVLKVVRTRMDLPGLAAPKRSMNLQATMGLDAENESLQAQLAEASSAALAEKECELANLRTQLAKAHPAVPLALAVLARKAEQP